MGENLIKIQMLGGFCISAGESSLEEASIKAPKLWKALQYLIAFRSKSVSQEELIFAIWPECEQGTPKNSMHNMIFRIRSVLASSEIPFGKEMLLSNGGGYCWNNSLNCVVDCEEFEKQYAQACAENIEKQAKLEGLLQAIDLYKGDFLPNASSEMWVIPLASYYRALYIQCVHTVLELLMERKQYAQVEMTCKKALMIDQFDETIHEYHLRAIIQQKKQAIALAEYQTMANLFYEVLGVEPSESLRALYLDIQSLCNDSELSMEALTQEWLESAKEPGAYYCEYGVFKMVYQLEARSILRSGKSVYLLSMAIRENPESRQKNHAAMSRLQTIIQSSLRKGDLFARAAPNQYVLLLQGLTYEDCRMLSKRIARRYNKADRTDSLKIQISPITPIH